MSAGAEMERGGRIGVVVCDDHRVVAEALAAVLAIQPDLDVVATVGTVVDLLGVVRGGRPHVVLLDYELPDGDGVAATAALKAAVPDVKVVMLTSYTDESVLLAAMEAGCSGYVTKHSGSAEVAAAVRGAAAGEAVVSPDMLARLLPRLARGTDRAPGRNLTARELEVLELLADGASSHEMAARLFLSGNTVRNHVQSVLTKLGAHSRLQAVSIAVREGIVSRR